MHQTAIFNFQSLLLVILLFICTSTYVHSLFPGIMDRNKEGYVLSLLSRPLPFLRQLVHDTVQMTCVLY